jgi:histidine triad (HIT) family protein
MGECIFCQIVAGWSPSSIFYQDEVVVGLMDINPVTECHVMIIPKQHATFLGEMDEETGRHLWTVAQRTAAALRAAAPGCEGINLFLADGAVAFQEVFHVHLHVIPRYRGDTFRVEAAWDLNPAREELDRLAGQIGAAYRDLWGGQPS